MTEPSRIFEGTQSVPAFTEVNTLQKAVALISPSNIVRKTMKDVKQRQESCSNFRLLMGRQGFWWKDDNGRSSEANHNP